MFKFLKPAKPSAKPSVAKKPTAAKAVADSAAKPDKPDKPKPMGSLSGGARKTYPMTPERTRLIEDAMKVHRAQQHLFDELTESDRRRLMLMSMLLMLQGRVRETGH